MGYGAIPWWRPAGSGTGRRAFDSEPRCDFSSQVRQRGGGGAHLISAPFQVVALWEGEKKKKKGPVAPTSKAPVACVSGLRPLGGPWLHQPDSVSLIQNKKSHILSHVQEFGRPRSDAVAFSFDLPELPSPSAKQLACVCSSSAPNRGENTGFWPVRG